MATAKQRKILKKAQHKSAKKFLGFSRVAYLAKLAKKSKKKKKK